MGVLATLDNSDHKSLCPQISSSLEEVSAFSKYLVFSFKAFITGVIIPVIYKYILIFTCILLSNVCLSYYTHSTMKAKTTIVLFIILIHSVLQTLAHSKCKIKLKLKM